MGDKVLLKEDYPLKANIRFRTVGKILCIMFRGHHTSGLSVFKIASVAGWR